MDTNMATLTQGVKENMETHSIWFLLFLQSRKIFGLPKTNQATMKNMIDSENTNNLYIFCNRQRIR